MPGPSYPAGVRLLPNAVTVLALCSGLSAVYFALGGRFELCVAAVGAAALCDALDGRLARLLDATTRIGAELDSLSDLVSFGVAPALVLYVWQLEGSRFGWTVALVFAVCMMLRLARFNTLIDGRGPVPVHQGVLRRRPRAGRGAGGRPAAVRDAAPRAGLVVQLRCWSGCGRCSWPG